jgi:transcriptional regulator with XRE-family HTH domain
MAKISELPEHIKILRVKQGMNQTDLGKYLGVGQTAVSAWETGDNTPPAEALVRMGNLASYPDCLFFYEKAGMDLKRVTAVGDTLKTCLDFVKQHMGSRDYEQLQGRITGMNQEDQLNSVLESMGGLSHLVGEPFDEMASVVLQLVKQINPAEAEQLNQHLWSGTPYDKIKWIKGTAAKILYLK